eukprot:GHVO01050704.1.p1 GENE.GHVO01050704.1~~GHVO01050704.1.p1  ORF type:complete len:248 (+),score=47.34 GHVO01050704.1:996-1739(+)
MVHSTSDAKEVDPTSDAKEVDPTSDAKEVDPTSDAKEVKILMLGLGGGVLLSLIVETMKCLPLQINCTAVELEKAVGDLAVDHFGLKELLDGNRSKIRVVYEDALSWIRAECDNEGTKYDMIIVDISNCEEQESRRSPHPLGELRCPHPDFVSQDFLEVAKRLLDPQGLLVTNVVCRNPAVVDAAHAAMKKVFPSVERTAIPRDVNVVMVATGERTSKYTFPVLEALRRRAVFQIESDMWKVLSTHK